MRQLKNKCQPRFCKHRFTGFTLIELLVVIAIIAVLLSILLPSLRKAKMHAQVVACGANLKQQAIALRLYVADNRGRLPIMTAYGDAVRTYMNVSKKSGQPGDFGGLDGDDKFFRCPSQKKEASGVASYSQVGYQSYGVNYFNVFSVEDWAKPSTLGSSIYYTVEMGKSRILDNVPNTTYMVADAHGGWIFTPLVWTFSLDLDKDRVKDSYYFPGLDRNNPHNTPEFWYNFFAPRHDKRGNFMFPDGSVRMHSILDFVTNQNKIWGQPKRP